MTTATTQRHEIVYLEPKRDKLDEQRATVLAASPLMPGEHIETPDEYTAVAAYEARLSGFIDQAEPIFDEHCSAAHRVWKQACAIRSAFIDVPKQLKAQCRALLGDFKDREARARRLEEQRRQDEERRIAEAQQKRQADLLKKQGQPELAEVVRHQPIDVPAIVLPSSVPEIAGLGSREDWYWEPVGGDTPANRARALSLLVRKEWVTFVKLDDAALTAFARRTKGTQRVPGIIFASRQVIVRR